MSCKDTQICFWLPVLKDREEKVFFSGRGHCWGRLTFQSRVVFSFSDIKEGMSRLYAFFSRVFLVWMNRYSFIGSLWLSVLFIGLLWLSVLFTVFHISQCLFSKNIFHLRVVSDVHFTWLSVVQCFLGNAPRCHFCEGSLFLMAILCFSPIVISSSVLIQIHYLAVLLLVWLICADIF